MPKPKRRAVKSTSERKIITNDKRSRAAPIAGTAVVWPQGVQQRYGISPVTRWHWERKKLLPARDVHIGGRSGWRPETLEAAENPQNEASAE